MFRIFFADLVRMLQPPTTIKLAEEELEQAKRELLKAHSAQEYAHHMANFHSERIERLNNFINQQENPCQLNQLPAGTNAPDPTPLRKTSTSNSDVTLRRSWK